VTVSGGKCLLEQLIRTTTVVDMEALLRTGQWVQSDDGQDMGIASIVVLCFSFACALGAALILLTAWLPGRPGCWGLS